MTPFDGAIAAARTCYSPRVIGTAEVTDTQRDTIGALTFDAGHHTVYQHAHFEFGLENISRQFVWTFLHSYPFYNSEQSSQRYVKLKEPRAFVPPLAGEALRRLRARDRARVGSLRRALGAAQGRCPRDSEGAALRPADDEPGAAEADRAGRREARDRDRPLRDSDRRVHLDGAHRLRHRAASPAPDGEHRRRAVRGACGHRRDGAAGQGVGSALLREGRAWRRSRRTRCPRRASRRRAAAATATRQSSTRGSNGRWSRLRDASPDAEEIVAESVRSVFGLTAAEMTDDEALDRVMNPARNRYRLDVLNVSHHSPLMRALHHATYVFEKRLSHTADSQDQRHRMVPASRPLMTFADTAQPDYITPRLIAANPRAKAVYDEAMREAWTAKNRLLELGVPLEFALYVLPNAKTLRFVESGSLLALLHKWTLRTCFNAQEEIYLASMDEIAAGASGASAHRPAHRPAVRHPQRADLAALHRGNALLRRAGLAGFPAAVRGSDAVRSRTRLRRWIGCDRLARSSLHRERERSSPSSPLARSSTSTIGPRSSGLASDHRRRHRRRARPRASASRERIPWFNGAKLDDIVDYLTYVFVPALFVWRGALVPDCVGAAGRRRDAAVERLRLQPQTTPRPPITSSPASRRTGTSWSSTC